MGFLDNLFGKRPKDVVVLEPKKPQKPASRQTIIEPANQPAPPAVIDEEIPGMLDLGWYYSAEKDQLQMAKIPLKDRAIHMYVIGASGSGKTKFLEFPIQQDIRLGNGFGIIDPHGDLIDETIGFLAQYYDQTHDDSIFDRVVIVDPTDPKFTVAFNPLEILPGVEPIEQAQELVMVFKSMWPDAWGARMEDLFRNALIALGEAGLTLAQMPAFLTVQSFRSQVMQKVDQPITKLYWERFDQLGKANQLVWTDPVTNKVNAFLADYRLHQMLSQPKSSFNLRDIMDHKKILLIKLNKGKLRQSADLLGSLFMAKLQLAAFSRADIPIAARVPFYLYIDEFQNFASESFGVVLSEARKYGLSLILAHQTLEQIPRELRSVILGNAGIQVYFRTNREDAELLAKEAFIYDGYQVKTMQISGDRMNTKFWSMGEEWEHNFAQLQNMPPRHCLIKHKIQGGMIRLETAAIEPAWQALNLSPEEYLEYLDDLPFGHKYLLERTALTQLPATPSELPPTPSGNSGKTSPPPEVKPKLEPEEQAFLEFIIANPDTPISTVYKELQVSVRRGNDLRDSLKTQGFIEEIETRLGAAGRRTIFFVPTFTAFELLGKEPPPGRGGAIHRHIQHLIEEGAAANGFTAKCEHDLGNGGIVDVHLEKGDYRVAVEIAIASRPSREIAHIKNAIVAGYDRVFDVFVDQRLLDRTQEALLGGFSAENREKIQLLHLSKLNELIYAIVSVVGGRVNLPTALEPGE